MPRNFAGVPNNHITWHPSVGAIVQLFEAGCYAAGPSFRFAALYIIVKDFADDGVHLLQAALEYLFIEVFLVFVHNYRSSMQSYEKRGRGKRKPPIWWDRG